MRLKGMLIIAIAFFVAAQNVKAQSLNRISFLFQELVHDASFYINSNQKYITEINCTGCSSIKKDTFALSSLDFGLFKAALRQSLDSLHDTTTLSDDKAMDARALLLFEKFQKYAAVHETLNRLDASKEVGGQYVFQENVELKSISKEFKNLQTAIDNSVALKNVVDNNKGKAISASGIDVPLKVLITSLNELNLYKVNKIYKRLKKFRYGRITVNATFYNRRIHKPLQRVLTRNKFQFADRDNYDPMRRIELQLVEKFLNHKDSTPAKTIATVQSVEINHAEGSIKHMRVRVKTADKEYMFTNYHPIPIKTLKDTDGLFDVVLLPKNIKSNDYYILLRDIIDFVPNILSKSDDYSVDGVIVNSRDSNEGFMTHRNVSKGGLDSYFNIKMYSDLKGISEQSPNGLIQVEPSFQVFTNGSRKKVTTVKWIALSLKFSKIEDKLKTFDRVGRFLPEGETDTTFFISTVELLQYSKMAIKLEGNILNIRPGGLIGDVNLDGGIGLLFTDVKDPHIRQFVTPRTLNSFNYNLRLSALLKPGGNIRFNPFLNFEFVSLSDNGIIKQSAGDNSDFGIATYKRISPWPKLLFNPGIEVYFHPLSNENNKLYFRTNLFQDMYRDNNFFQIQIGYSLNINDLIKRSAEVNKTADTFGF